MTVPLAAALLAGGRSARMGRPKAGVVVDGATMAARALDALRGLGVPVVVVGHAESVDAPDGVRVLKDARADVGPLGGVEALLASGIADAYVVLPVDMPRVTTALLRALVDGRGAARAAVLRGDDRVHPFPLVLEAGALAVLRTRLDAGQRRVVDFVAVLDPVVVPLDAARAGELVDVDTPEDLARM